MDKIFSASRLWPVKTFMLSGICIHPYKWFQIVVPHIKGTRDPTRIDKTHSKYLITKLGGQREDIETGLGVKLSILGCQSKYIETRIGVKTSIHGL